MGNKTNVRVTGRAFVTFEVDVDTEVELDDGEDATRAVLERLRLHSADIRGDRAYKAGLSVHWVATAPPGRGFNMEIIRGRDSA